MISARWPSCKERDDHDSPDGWFAPCIRPSESWRRPAYGWYRAIQQSRAISNYFCVVLARGSLHAVPDLSRQIDDLDVALFAHIESQTTDWDRRALLAVHSVTAHAKPGFCYLEIGSYLGGSLQVVMRDPRCGRVISVDPRPEAPPDKRLGTWRYEDNSTQRMIGNIRGLPEVDLGKLTSFSCTAKDLKISELPARPAWCFIDGEHTDQAAWRDAIVCAEAMEGSGILVFHDYELVQPAICQFVREAWSEISYAAAFSRNHMYPGGGIFALELGGEGLLPAGKTDEAMGSWWHAKAWRMASRGRSPEPLLRLWGAMPRIDTSVASIRRRASGFPTRHRNDA